MKTTSTSAFRRLKRRKITKTKPGPIGWGFKGRRDCELGGNVVDVDGGGNNYEVLLNRALG